MKPSIFSREYERKMKKRKRRITTLIVLLLIISGVFFANSKLNFSSSLSSVYKKAVQYVANIHNVFGKGNKVSDNKKDKNNQISSVSNVQTQTEPQKDDDKYYDLTINGLKAKAVYEDNAGVKKYKFVILDDPSKMEYTISPSGTGIVLLDKSSQCIFYVNMNGEATAFTNPKYTAASDGSVFIRENVLKDNPSYIWCASPKFVDDKNIVYISQVPWFDNRATRYIWSVNVDSKIHSMVRGVEGENISIGNITDNGLELNLDNKIRYLAYSNDDGVVIK